MSDSDDKKLERIELKLDDANEHMQSIDITLQEQHLTLKEHIRRTEVLEKAVGPIKRDIDMFKGAVALIGLLATIAGIIAIIKH